MRSCGFGLTKWIILSHPFSHQILWTPKPFEGRVLKVLAWAYLGEVPHRNRREDIGTFILFQLIPRFTVTPMSFFQRHLCRRQARVILHLRLTYRFMNVTIFCKVRSKKRLALRWATTLTGRLRGNIDSIPVIEGDKINLVTMPSEIDSCTYTQSFADSVGVEWQYHCDRM